MISHFITENFSIFDKKRVRKKKKTEIYNTARGKKPLNLNHRSRSFIVVRTID